MKNSKATAIKQCSGQLNKLKAENSACISKKNNQEMEIVKLREDNSQ